MDFPVNTKEKPCTIALNFACRGRTSVSILCVNPDRKNTVYINSKIVIDGSGKFFIRMPKSPKKVMVRIIHSGRPEDFKIIGIEQPDKMIIPLKQKLSAFNFLDPKIISFIDMMQQFCELAGILSAGGRSIYYSDDGRFRFDYVDKIKDTSGRELTTPAAAGKITKKMSFAYDYFYNETVTARATFATHEFAHAYLNKDVDNEEEADLHALKILLGLGYSRKEILYGFTRIFSRSHKVNGNSEINNKRIDRIVEFINKFENTNFPNLSYYYEGEGGKVNI